MAKHDAANKKMPLGTPYPMSKFNTMNGLSRQTVNLPTDSTAIMIVWWSPSGFRCILNYKGTTVTGASTADLSCYLTETPVTLRHLRQSVKIRNVTKADNVAGTVRTLLMTEQPSNPTAGSGNPFTWETATYDNFVNYCRAQNETVSFSAAELRATRSFPLVPGHAIAHQDYQPWVSIGGAIDIQTMYRTQGTKEAVLPMMFLFENPGAAQVYDISIHTQDACQYAASSALTLIAYAPTVTREEQRAHENKVLALHAARGVYENELAKFNQKYKEHQTGVGAV
jgi:hypothetical protein